MARTVGIRYRRADKIYFCSPGELNLKLNNHVIVRTDKGEEYGWVTREPQDVVHDQTEGPSGNVMRVATSADLLRRQDLEAQNSRALRLAKENVREMGYPSECSEGSGGVGRRGYDFCLSSRVLL